MKQIFPLLTFVLFMLYGNLSVKAQSTYAQVYQIIHTNCANASCHDGSSPTFNARLSPDSLYNSIINATPVNPAAGLVYNKIVAPGDVQRSFLLRKIAHGISDGLDLNQPSEGLDMPDGLPALSNMQIELVRQWILFGAPETGSPVDTGLINSYYRNGGINDTYSPHTPPAPGTGFQIYLGRVFLPKDTEIEYFYKWDPHFTSDVEAKAVYTYMPAADHHFLVALFDRNADALYPVGLRPLSESSMENVQYGIGTGAGLWSYVLPQGTAFFFPQWQKFDLDLHIQNPNVDSIYSADVYVNFLTQPVGTASQYMQVNNFPNLNISIPEDGQPHVFNLTCTDSTQTQYWNLWKLYTHTHKYGTAFNVWLRNPDGSQGAEIYNGNYSYEDGYDVGYYRWGPHVTFRTWPADSLFPVNPLYGLIGQATWVNTAGPNPTVWGFSSSDEMMDVGFFYVPGANLPTTGINNVAPAVESFKVYPNPVVHDFTLSYDVDQTANVEIALYDMMGNKVSTLQSGVQAVSGKYTKTFNTLDLNLAAGMYFIKLDVGDKTDTEKLIVTD